MVRERVLGSARAMVLRIGVELRKKVRGEKVLNKRLGGIPRTRKRNWGKVGAIYPRKWSRAVN